MLECSIKSTLSLSRSAQIPGRSTVLNDPVLNGATIRTRVRRRRSWYRRRLRRQRRLVAVFLGSLVAFACWQNAARLLSLPAFHSSQVLPASFWERANLHKDLALAAARSARPAKFHARTPGVYPYSVVPGGVKGPNELRSVAARDNLVRR